MRKNPDLLLINPGNRAQCYGKLAGSLAGIEPPLWCGLIAGFVRKYGYSVEIIDADAENWSPEYTAEKIAECNPLLAGVIVFGTNPAVSATPKMAAVRETLKELKNKAPNITTILGGLHPSALPERTLREEKVDFVCKGEGFFTFLALLDILKSGKNPKEYEIEGLWHIRDGKVISNPAPAPVRNLDELPFAAWDLLPMHKYRAHNWHCFEDLDKREPYAVIYTSIGCPFNCSYCPIHIVYGSPGIRFASPERVIGEIDLLVNNYNIRNIKIIDELFVIKEERVMRLCELIIQREYKLNIWAYARVDTVNERMLKRMKEAGINWLCYGVESGSRRVRQGVSKRITQEKIKKAVEMTRAAGIYILGNFIFGLPDDDLQTMQESLDLAKELNFDYVNFYVAMAYPGSRLYKDALKQGIRLPEAWQDYGQYTENLLPLPTNYVSAQEVLRFRDNAFEEYFRNPRYMEMVEQKFGPKAAEHIEGMLRHKIQRKFT
ncbi:MAG: cobalamin-dependent protein [Candidatus Omnitrophota bacterium]|nr:MAG: cobalamin-dependent protein [Candidatus Omnitrophota bacterium]